MLRKTLLPVLALLLTTSCSEDAKKDGSDSPGKSYSFSAAASVALKTAKLSLLDSSNHGQRLAGAAENLCATGQTISCAAPSKITGKYYSVGLLIQASGQGMQSYLLGDSWSSIVGTSPTYDFDSSAPITSSGTISCCGGSGDLSGENTYFSNAAYMFGYLDVTFTIPYSAAQLNQVNAEMKSAHTVRFVLADNVVSGYKRGDLLYQDTDLAFKWMDSAGSLQSTRPATPLTMDDMVVNYTSPWPEFTNPIPVIYTEIADNAQGKITTSEAALSKANTTYTFGFDTSYLVTFMLAPEELTIIQSKKEMLSRIHLQGLPHSKFTFGVAGMSSLTVQ